MLQALGDVGALQLCYYVPVPHVRIRAFARARCYAVNHTKSTRKSHSEANSKMYYVNRSCLARMPCTQHAVIVYDLATFIVSCTNCKLTSMNNLWTNFQRHTCNDLTAH